MAISNEQREEILLNSFNILKDNVEENIVEIQDILTQLVGLNPRIVIRLWHYLIENNIKLIENDKSSFGIRDDLLGGMFSNLASNYKFPDVEYLLKKDNYIVEMVFSKSTVFYDTVIKYLGNLIKNKELNEAYRIIDLLYNNNNLKNYDPFDIVLQKVIEELLTEKEYGNAIYSRHDELEYEEDVQELIKYWIDRVKNKEAQAKLNIYFLKIC